MNEAEATVLQLFEARLKPSREQKLQFRRAVMLLRQLDGADLRLARFWLDYKWLLDTVEDPQMQQQDEQEAFRILLENALGPSCSDG